MKRSKKKGPFIFLKHHKNNSLLHKNQIFVLKRNFEITFRLVGLACYVYDGRNFLKLSISENMVNHKLGEFVPTRGKFVYKSKKKKKKK